jgi:hypothetical protein
MSALQRHRQMPVLPETGNHNPRPGSITYAWHAVFSIPHYRVQFGGGTTV